MDIYKFTGPKFLKEKEEPDHSFALDTLTNQKFWFSPASNQDNDDDLKFTASPKLIINCYNDYKELYGRKYPISYEDFQKKFDLTALVESNMCKIRKAHILCSFTEINSDYMWNKYAANRSGFCAVYDLEDLQEHFKKQNIVFKKVQYGDLPQLESYDYNYLENQFAIPVCITKPLGYVREKEWRAITPAPSDCSPNGMELDAILPKKILYMNENIVSTLIKPLEQYCSDNNIPIERI